MKINTHVFGLFTCILLLVPISCDRNVDPEYTADDTDPIVDDVYISDHEEDSDYSWDESSVIEVELKGSTIICEGDGVNINGSTALITAAGTYKLSGTLSNGQISVDTEDEEVVRLILNSAELNNSSYSPLYIVNATKTIIVLAEDTENIVSDAGSYSYDKAGDNEPNAAIFSHDNLTIFGEGSLKVEGNYNDGIASKDGLIVKSGSITVNAIDDGIRGKDYLLVKGGNVTVDALGDGLKSDNDTNSDAGFISIDDGSLHISSLDKGVVAETYMSVNGGTINIDAGDDAIHSDGDIGINGGIFSLVSGDDAIHADLDLVVNRGEIYINSAYEGLESAEGNIHVNDGIIKMVTSDDGFNVAAGGDSSGGRQKSTESTTASYLFQINGGYIVINASGDGLDSNGDFEMTGGDVIVSGSSMSSNSALDVNGTLTVHEGFLVAAGSSKMAQAPGSSSDQNSILVTFNATQAGGTLVHIENQDGDEILDFEPPKSFDSMAFSSPELIKGETYTIYLGGSHSGTPVDGVYEDGTYNPGNSFTSFTVSSTVNYINR